MPLRENGRIKNILSVGRTNGAAFRVPLYRAALLLALAVLLAVGTCAAGARLGVLWQEKAVPVDLSGDGAAEMLTLARRALTVSDAAGETVWQSEPGWRVQDFFTGDIDGDGAPELLVLLEKRGSYGSVRPFWVERDETGYSQHIFIYRWDRRAEALRSVWMASALPVRVRLFSLEADGVTIRLVTTAGEESLWRWQSFGLARVDVPPGTYAR